MNWQPVLQCGRRGVFFRRTAPLAYPLRRLASNHSAAAERSLGAFHRARTPLPLRIERRREQAPDYFRVRRLRVGPSSPYMNWLAPLSAFLRDLVRCLIARVTQTAAGEGALLPSCLCWLRCLCWPSYLQL
jgi:hypothetical protein